MANLNVLGKMNWIGLLAYTVQPADMDLFQQYVFGQASNRLAGERGPGVVYGCVLSVVAGMQIQVSAGLLVMPDGSLIQMPALTSTLTNGDGSNPRIDRVEIVGGRGVNDRPAIHPAVLGISGVKSRVGGQPNGGNVLAES